MIDCNCSSIIIKALRSIMDKKDIYLHNPSLLKQIYTKKKYVA